MSININRVEFHGQCHRQVVAANLEDPISLEKAIEVFKEPFLAVSGMLKSSRAHMLFMA